MSASAAPGAQTVEGSGIVVTPSGVVLTNNHVIDGAARVRATDLETGRTYGASVLGYDAGEDVAVLKLRGAADLPSVGLRRFSRPRPGTRVVAVAVGHRRAVGRITGTAASIVEYSQLTGATRLLSGLLVSSARVGPGYSGGPLVDRGGGVVGMDVAYVPGVTRPLGYAIPAGAVVGVARHVLSNRPSAGVHVGPTAGLGAQITPVASIGAVVVAVRSGSAIAKAGLRAGDVVDEVTGVAVKSPTALSAVLQAYEPGDRVSVGWLTPQGKPAKASVRLGVGPPG